MSSQRDQSHVVVRTVTLVDGHAGKYDANPAGKHQGRAGAHRSCEPRTSWVSKPYITGKHADAESGTV